MKRIFTIIILLSTIKFSGQTKQIDSLLYLNQNDISFYICKNCLTKNKFLGNCWYLDASYTRCNTNIHEFSFGRSYVTTFGWFFIMRSWGAGYGFIQQNQRVKNLGMLFAEISTFNSFMPVTYRAEYIYDYNDKSHYLKPSFGANFLFVDLLYSYSFNLNKSENKFKHGFTLRLKFYDRPKKWEKHFAGFFFKSKIGHKI